jgi:hypothetical protein
VGTRVPHQRPGSSGHNITKGDIILDCTHKKIDGKRRCLLPLIYYTSIAASPPRQPGASSFSSPHTYDYGTLLNKGGGRWWRLRKRTSDANRKRPTKGSHCGLSMVNALHNIIIL